MAKKTIHHAFSMDSMVYTLVSAQSEHVPGPIYLLIFKYEYLQNHAGILKWAHLSPSNIVVEMSQVVWVVWWKKKTIQGKSKMTVKNNNNYSYSCTYSGL